MAAGVQVVRVSPGLTVSAFVERRFELLWEWTSGECRRGSRPGLR